MQGDPSSTLLHASVPDGLPTPLRDIFLPAAGYRNNGNLNNEGSNGYYWSSSLNESNSNNGRNLNFNEGNFNPWNNNNRYNGQSVRPVCPSAALIIVKTVYHYKTRA